MNNFAIFLVLITIVCFLLILVIMVQNPKGGGLSSSLGGSQMMGGVQKTTDFLDKSTWVLGAILIGLILVSTLSFPGMLGTSESKITNGLDATPAATAPAPATENAPEAAPATEQPATPAAE